MRFSKLSYDDKKLNPKTLTSIIINAYLFIFFAIYPFYMKEGYIDLGNYKYYFFLYSSLITVLLLLVTGIIPLIKEISKERITGNVFFKTDIFTLLFLLVTIISFFLSEYRNEAFLGTDGWYMGFLTIIIMFVISFLVSRLWIPNLYVIYISLIASALVFLLGICDRFSLYIIPLEVRNPSFISTIGNINWFMGYYSVFVPLGTCLMLLLNKEDIKKKYFLTAYVIVSFVAGFAQGSESVLLFDAALFTGLLFVILKTEKQIKDWFILLFLWGISAQIFRVLKMVFSSGYNYPDMGILGVLTDSFLPVIVIIFGLGGYYIFSGISANMESESYNKLERKMIYAFMSVPLAMLLVWFALALLRSNGMILRNVDSSLLILNENFGNGRGMAYKTAYEAFQNMNLKQKMIGCGPDVFRYYLYSQGEIASDLLAYWPNDILTNAHNELLTMLINEGILGAVFYAGIFVSFIRSVIKKEKEPLIMCINLSVFCYFVHNMISFANIMNLPFLLILMGIGEGFCLNKGNYEIKNSNI